MLSVGKLWEHSPALTQAALVVAQQENIAGVLTTIWHDETATPLTETTVKRPLFKMIIKWLYKNLNSNIFDQ